MRILATQYIFEGRKGKWKSITRGHEMNCLLPWKVNESNEKIHGNNETTGPSLEYKLSDNSSQKFMQIF